MARLRIIKDLKDTKNSDLLQLIKGFIYGDRNLGDYESGKQYNKHDVVIKYDAESQRFVIYKCIVNQSSPNWVESEWEKENITNASFSFSDKLITHQTTDPNDVHNKLWFRDTVTNSNGTIDTVIKIKDVDGTYKILYPATITKNVFLDENRTHRLSDKLDRMDSEDDFIHSKFLKETMDMMESVDNLLPRSKQQELMTILDPMDTEDITTTGDIIRVNGLIIL